MVTNEATNCSINGGLIIPPLAISNGKILCNNVIIPVTNRVINNKGNKGNIHLILDALCSFLIFIFVFN